MKLLRPAAGAAAALAAATLVVGAWTSGGVDAAFASSADVGASISVASSFDDVAVAALFRAAPATCTISAPGSEGSAVTIAANQRSLTVDLGNLVATGDTHWSSDVAVKNTTDGPVALTWSASVPADESNSSTPAVTPVSDTIDVGATTTAALRLSWDASAEPPTGTVTFTAECAVAPVVTPSPSEPTTTGTGSDDPPPTTTETTDTDTDAPPPTTTP